jgi:microsomal dipeptidase-like Zn-dependent dipeptidase
VFDKPFSILGASSIENIVSKMGERILGHRNVCDLKAGSVRIIGGKILINLANVFTKPSKETIDKILKHVSECR